MPETNPIQDTAGNRAVAFTDFAVTNNSTVDGTPPVPASAEVRGAGDSLSLTFNEDLDIAAVPPASAFTVKADGVEVAVQSVLASILDTLALRSFVHDQAGPDGHGELQGARDQSNPGCRRQRGRGFTDFEVTNNSTVIPDGTPPVPASAEVRGAGDRLSLTFNEDLDIGQCKFPRPAPSRSRPTASR